MSMIIVAILCAAAAFAKAATTIERVTEDEITRYVITVPDGETYTLTESDAESFDTYDILKRAAERSSPKSTGQTTSPSTPSRAK